jgi:hypothetical protein
MTLWFDDRIRNVLPDIYVMRRGWCQRRNSKRVDMMEHGGKGLRKSEHKGEALVLPCSGYVPGISMPVLTF